MPGALGVWARSLISIAIAIKRKQSEPPRSRGIPFFSIFETVTSYSHKGFCCNDLRRVNWHSQFVVKVPNRCIVSTERLESVVLEFPVLPVIFVARRLPATGPNLRRIPVFLGGLWCVRNNTHSPHRRALPRKGVVVANAGQWLPPCEGCWSRFVPCRRPWMVGGEEASKPVTDGTARQH